MISDAKRISKFLLYYRSYPKFRALLHKLFHDKIKSPGETYGSIRTELYSFFPDLTFIPGEPDWFIVGIHDNERSTFMNKVDSRDKFNLAGKEFGSYGLFAKLWQIIITFISLNLNMNLIIGI